MQEALKRSNVVLYKNRINELKYRDSDRVLVKLKHKIQAKVSDKLSNQVRDIHAEVNDETDVFRENEQKKKGTKFMQGNTGNH